MVNFGRKTDRKGEKNKRNDQEFGVNLIIHERPTKGTHQKGPSFIKTFVSGPVNLSNST